ncbi:hypothetical protein A4U64_26670 (plasmid) [Rhodococcus sp. WB1]|uniref:eCIS core domain-containing protein n=1 Tax=Rhodococcus sp. WB1 TaxID=1033922 RepID=UPI00081A505C|nr:DUF4157 domain-containing protein [Rhodococcus sp. WB1]ANZ28478.1 hypothetical protein A4U64_26670 [Rhodococcus sp. WB1]
MRAREPAATSPGVGGARQARAGPVTPQADVPVGNRARLMQRSCDRTTSGCGCGGDDREDGVVRRTPAGPGSAGLQPVPPTVDRVLRSGGVALDPGVRRLMESRFSHDFGGVRVHTDAAAASSAKEVGATAYTRGHDVVFAAGRYSPQSVEGVRLLAHELAHVIQQASTPMAGSLWIGNADAPEEYEARRVADEVLGSGPVRLPRPTGIGFLYAEDNPTELRRQLVALEKKAAESGSLPTEEVTALQQERAALQHRLVAAVRASVRPAGGGAASLSPAGAAASPPAVLSAPVGENPTPESMVRLVVEQRQFAAAKPTPEGGIPPIPHASLAEGTRGTPAGPGYQTNAAIKIVDAQGNQVAFELAVYEGGGNPHAEAQGVTRLRLRLGGRTLPGGRVIVAVDQVACGGCLARLRAFAEELKAAAFEVWAPTAQEGRTAGPKTTARTAATAPARPGPPPVSETPGGAAYRYVPKMIQGESLPISPPPAPSSAAAAPSGTATGPGPVEKPAVTTPETVAPVEKPTVTTPEVGTRRPGLAGGRLKGIGSGVLSFFGPIAVGWIHQRAVQKRVKEQAASQGYVPEDAPSGEGRLYDLGAWLIDPGRDAELSVPPSSRINVPVWRIRIRATAAAKGVGDTMSFGWDVGECRFDIFGRQVVNRHEVVYRKGADGRWTVKEGDSVGTLDLNRVIDPTVPDSAIEAAIFADPCTA